MRYVVIFLLSCFAMYLAIKGKVVDKDGTF